MSKTIAVRQRRSVSTPRRVAWVSPSYPSETATQDISGALTAVLADAFALYVKTKNFPVTTC